MAMLLIWQEESAERPYMKRRLKSDWSTEHRHNFNTDNNRKAITPSNFLVFEMQAYVPSS